MKKYKSKSISSKWRKTKWLMAEQSLRDYVPRTKLFKRGNLTSMLNDYSTVFFKPTTGSGGVNIIRIKKVPEGYQTQLKNTKTSYKTEQALYNKLNRRASKRSYVLQKGIRLAKTKGRPFDIRVMVQKTKQGEWVSTALFTKIGSPGKVATNYNQGGKVGYFHPTMSGAGYSPSEIKRMESRLKEMGVAVGRSFDRNLKGFKELGLDVAIDTNGKPWILEVNTRPQVYPLKHMKDKTMYQRIVSYGKAYGRFK